MRLTDINRSARRFDGQPNTPFIEGMQKITLTDVASPLCDGREFQHCEELLSVVAATAIELITIWSASPDSVAEVVCDHQAELEQQYGWEYIHALAEFLLSAELPKLSARYSALFDEWNATYFSNRLPSYDVHVVFDINTFANEPIADAGACSGLIRSAEQCIYVRYEEERLMLGMLVHEMAHAATDGNHDELWNCEMRHLTQAGAPVLTFDFD